MLYLFYLHFLGAVIFHPKNFHLTILHGWLLESTANMANFSPKQHNVVLFGTYSSVDIV